MGASSPPEVPDLGASILEAAENAGVGVVITRLAPQVENVYASSAAARMLGVSTEEALRISPFDIVPPDERSVLADRIEARRGGAEAPRRLTQRIRRADGSEATIEVGVAAVEIDGSPASMLFLTDVSERTRTEETLRRSEARFRALVESAPDAIVIGRDRRITFANAAAAVLLGFESSDAMMGHGFERILHPEDYRTIGERMAALRLGGPPIGPIEYRGRTLDGRALVVEVTSVLFEDVDGPAVIGFARDVTSARRMQAQLMRADRLAALGTMAAGVAHEINNPLAFMMLGLDAIEKQLARPNEERDSDAIRATIADVRHGVERIGAIVRQLRTFSRSDESAPRAAADLRAVLDAATRMASHEIKHVGRLAADVADDIPPVCGEPSQLEQVFVNLLLNAAQALDERHDGLVEVIARVRDNKSVEVLVRDNGLGVEEDDLPHVFDPFFTTKSVGVGTGLGLSICHTIVSALGGEITVDSREGEGTTARVVLPVLRAALAPSTPPRGSSREPLPRLRVLVADDELAFVCAVERLLSPEHEVLIAGDGEEAWGLVEKMPDVILLDVMMPGLNGMDLFERIRAERPELERRVAFVTGGTSRARVERFLSRVGRPILRKPFDAERIDSLLRRLRRS